MRMPASELMRSAAKAEKSSSTSASGTRDSPPLAAAEGGSPAKKRSRTSVLPSVKPVPSGWRKRMPLYSAGLWLAVM